MDPPAPEETRTRIIQSLHFSKGAVEIAYIERNDVREDGKSYFIHSLSISRATHPAQVAYFEDQTEVLLTDALKDWAASRTTARIPDSATELRAALRYRAVVAPDLTPKEGQVLARIVAGDSTAAIAARLFMSESTVKSHNQRVYNKLGVHNRAGVVMAAIRLGIIAPE